MSAMAPPSTHTPSVKRVVPTRWATIAGLMKMPEPMIPPTTAIVPENSPRVRR
jgi:hypothetical protein